MITVVGSLNLDLFVEVPRLPAVGETLLGGNIRREPGGKGANQACAIARMQQSVSLVGAVGRDAFGDELLQCLRRDKVDLRFVSRRDEVPTGTAFILVDPNGQNQIVVSPGANGTVTAADIEAAAGCIRKSTAVLTQLEIPPESVAMALRTARAAHVLTVLNPAPSVDLPDELLSLADWIVPNEFEASQLTGLPIRRLDDGAAAAQALRARAGGAGIVITLGVAGAWVESNTFCGPVPAFPVKAVDTVAAGDAFIGAFVTGLVEGQNPREAARFGCAAAALAVTRPGAQASLPHRAEAAALCCDDRRNNPTASLAASGG